MCSSDLYEGTATVLRRPRPVAQESLAGVARKVRPSALVGASALVVGGSRGIGEAGVKVFLAAGAMVTCTFRRGRSEAEALQAEAEAQGATLDIAPFDVLASAGLPAFRQAPFTHFIYCAAPPSFAHEAHSKRAYSTNTAAISPPGWGGLSPCLRDCGHRL